MLAVARALVARPKLILLDEPSLGLAPLVFEAMFTAIASIRARSGIGFLIVEQNAALALELADHVYLLEIGKVVTSGPSSMVQKDETLRKAYLGY